MATREEWADAFALQARSDWALYDRLSKLPGVPLCHQLHFLQMACEKIAKAYRARDTDMDVKEVTTHHVGFVKFVNAFFKSPGIRQDYEGKEAQLQVLAGHARRIAAQVEKLAPAADRVATPSNAEYPWEEAGCVVVPCEHDFPNLSLLREAGGRNFLKMVRRAVFDFEAVRIH